MSPWYRGGPKFWSKWINPRPLTKFASVLDGTFVTLIILIFILPLFGVPDPIIVWLIYGLTIVLLLHIYGLIFRTER